MIVQCFRLPWQRRLSNDSGIFISQAIVDHAGEAIIAVDNMGLWRPSTRRPSAACVQKLAVGCR